MNKTSTFVFGVGYIGIGKYDSKHISYKTWKNMFNRCYNKNYHSHHTYSEIKVSEEWKCLQNYAKWYEENYKEDFEVDKDILIKGNKIYSSETCCFVPQEINGLFVKANKSRGALPIGVKVMGNRFQARFNKGGKPIHLGTFDTIEEAFECYKFHKEKYIKEVADKWRGQITEPCYEAMYNYEVEITD